MKVRRFQIILETVPNRTYWFIERGEWRLYHFILHFFNSLLKYNTTLRPYKFRIINKMSIILSAKFDLTNYELNYKKNKI